MNILWKDIKFLKKCQLPNDDGILVEKYQINIRCRIQKGDHNSNHNVTLEGSIVDNDMSFVYWYYLFIYYSYL